MLEGKNSGQATGTYIQQHRTKFFLTQIHFWYVPFCALKICPPEYHLIFLPKKIKEKGVRNRTNFVHCFTEQPKIAWTKIQAITFI